MSFRIALNFEDGATRFIDCNAGEKVLDAAYRNKVNLPMDCSDGVCGTCKCHCEQGSYELGDEYIDEALTEGEAEQGMVLTCQMIPSSDCVITVPVAASVCKIAPQEVTVMVEAVDKLSAHRIRLVVRATQGALPAFLAGQYVNIDVPGAPGVDRSYSFSSLPGAEVGSFLIRNVDDGQMSSYLEHRAKVGDSLKMRGPLGSFYLREPKRPMLFIAGGTGIAPILSMLEVLAADGTGGHDVHLIYGVHDETDLVEMARIDALACRIAGFTVTPTCSGLTSGNPAVGVVTNHLDTSHLKGGDVDIYLCGPPVMVEAVRSHVEQLGVTPVGFHYEKFVPAQLEAKAA